MEILENFPKIILAFATCGVKKYRPHHAVSLLQFSENLKKAIKKLNGNEQKKKKKWKQLSCDTRLSLLRMKLALNQISERVLKGLYPQTFMLLKNHIMAKNRQWYL